MITPNKFLSAPFGQAFREYVIETVELLHLLDLSRAHIFEDVSIYPVVSLFRRVDPRTDYRITVKRPPASGDLGNATIIEQQSSDLNKLPEAIWGFLISEYLPLILKIEDCTLQLQQCATVRASSTAGEADSYATALSDIPSSQSKKFVNTGLIDRYHHLWGNHKLTHKGMVYGHPYLQLSNPVVPDQRKSQYNKQKVVFAKMALRPEAFFDKGEFASANTNFVYDSDCSLQYLTAVLNSRLMSVLYEGYFGALIMQGGYFQFQAPQLRVLPVPKIKFVTPEAERKARLDEVLQSINGKTTSQFVRWSEEELERGYRAFRYGSQRHCA